MTDSLRSADRDRARRVARRAKRHAPDLGVEEPATGSARLGRTLADPRRAEVEQILSLQRTVGNAAVTRLLETATGNRVQRDDWGKKYATRRARPGALTYEEYKKRIGQPGESEKFAPALKDASEWGGHKISPIAMTREELGQILKPEKPGDEAAAAAHEQRLDDYLPKINEAFEAMGIDTVEAQADYLANAGGESGSLAKLSEVGAEKRPYAPFIGRGPVQVTWEYGYVQTLAYLETEAQRLGDRADRAEGNAGEESGAESEAGTEGTGAEATPAEPLEPSRLRTLADLARRAVEAIKKDPAEAANPDYAFLFSAAYMQMSGGVRGAAKLGKEAAFTGVGAEDRWVTGRSTSFQTGLNKAVESGDTPAQNDMKSAISRARVKREVYKDAVDALWPRRVPEGLDVALAGPD